MFEWLKQLAYALSCRFKSRARLEAENLVLRQQLIVLIRELPKRLPLTNLDRLLLVWLYRLFPPYCYPNCQARDRDPLAPSRLSSVLALEISPRRRPATNPPQNSRPDPTDEHGQPSLGCAADSRRTAHARDRGGAVDCRENTWCRGRGDRRHRAGRPSSAIMRQ